jgi:hypothetical protein
MHKKQKWKCTSRAPKTLFPVVVLTKPTSRRALNGCLPSPSSTFKSSPVASSIIGETTLQAIAWKLMGIGSSQHTVTSKSGIGDLSHNVFVGKSDNIAVLWGVVLVLVLRGKTNPVPIVSFPSCACT